MSKAKTTITIYGRSSIEGAFREAMEQAGRLENWDEGNPNEWNRVESYIVRLVSIQKEGGRWRQDDDDHPEFIFEVEEA